MATTSASQFDPDGETDKLFPQQQQTAQVTGVLSSQRRQPAWRTWLTSPRVLLGLGFLAVLAVYWGSKSIGIMCPPRPPPVPSPTLLPVPSVTRVLVTGGAGYIGSHMTQLMLDQTEAYEIVAVDDLSRGDIRLVQRLMKSVKQPHKYTFVQGDCGDVELMTKLLKDNQIDVVIHFAGFAYASESVEFPLSYFDNIVTKTQGLLKAMENAEVKRLVYSSSSATYGQPLNEACDVPISEQSPQMPVSPYGRSKLMAEQVIAAYHNAQVNVKKKGFSYAAMRYFNVVGADRHSRVGALPHVELKRFSRIVDACFDAAIEDRPMHVYGSDYPTADGTAIRDYIHVSDLVRAHLLVIRAVHDNIAVPYNVGIGHGFSNKELVGACSNAVGHNVPILYKERRLGDPSLVLGDATRIRHDLQWVPEYTDLTEIVSTAWTWRQQIVSEEKKGETKEAAEKIAKASGLLK